MLTFEEFLSLWVKNEAKPGEQERKMSCVAEEKPGSCGLCIGFSHRGTGLGFFLLSSGYLASFPEFSVESWMWRGEHKEVIKKCQVMMNRSYSVYSQEV